MKALFCGVLLVVFSLVSAQETGESDAIDVNFLKSNIMLHSPDLAQLITGHPEGVMISFSKRTNGNEAWESLYNYPDYGGYFLYQDLKNEQLGKVYAVGAHYNFYFLNRNLMFKTAVGPAMTTNPYNKYTNSKNAAFGSKYMVNVNFMVNYKKDNIFDNFGIQGGLAFTHFSMGRFKTPNSGLNTIGVNVGINYNFREIQYHKIDTTASPMKYYEPVRFNVVLRAGFNESPVIGSGQKPLYHISAYADKRLNKKSALQLGAELFLTTSNKEYIKFRATSYPEEPIKQDTDYKRMGIFIGHELFINRISIEAQVGYYVYDPSKFDTSIYDRVGMKYYFTKNIFTGVSVKTHGFLAEALEAVIGIRI